MSGLFLVPDSAICATTPTDEGITAAMAALVQTAIDGGCTVRDLAGELFVVLSRVLGVDGARVTVAEGDTLLLGDPRPGPDVASAPGIRVEAAARPPSLAGLGSVVSMPLLSAGRAWGSLDLYWSGARVLTESDMATARSFAAIVAHSVAAAAGHDRVRTESLAAGDDQRHLSRDPLTGLPDLRVLSDKLDLAMISAVRSRAAVGVLSLDIDGFTAINDTMGLPFGDLVLTEVARRLRLALRTEDTLSRLSGDEFVIFCEGSIGSPPEIERRLRTLGRRLQYELRRPPEPGQIEVVVTVSIGIAITTRRRAAEEVIADAGRAMYRARERSRKKTILNERVIAGATLPLRNRLARLRSRHE